MNNSVEVVKHNLQTIANEISSMAATADEVKAAMEWLFTRPVGSVCLEIQAQILKKLESSLSPTCDLCCHYQSHPPRCLLSKRSISPKQFSCKKYSPKHNPRK